MQPSDVVLPQRLPDPCHPLPRSPRPSPGKVRTPHAALDIPCGTGPCASRWSLLPYPSQLGDRAGSVAFLGDPLPHRQAPCAAPVTCASSDPLALGSCHGGSGRSPPQSPMAGLGAVHPPTHPPTRGWPHCVALPHSPHRLPTRHGRGSRCCRLPAEAAGCSTCHPGPGPATAGDEAGSSACAAKPLPSPWGQREAGGSGQPLSAPLRRELPSAGCRRELLYRRRRKKIISSSKG